GCDLDLAWLQFLRKLTLQVDDQQAIAHRGAFDLDVVRQIELTLEVAGRDATMQVCAFGLVLKLAANRQPVALCNDGDVILAEASHRHDDAVPVLTALFDVVRRVTALLSLHGMAEEHRDPVETDRGSVQGGKVQCCHSYPPIERQPRNHRNRAPEWAAR